MGLKILNGSPQLSVRVTLLPLIIIVLLSTVTLETTGGTLLGIVVGIIAVLCVIEVVLV